MKSFLDHLECTSCSGTFDADHPHQTCPDCGKVLYPKYDLEGARTTFRKESLGARPHSMWRYREMLPVRNDANIVTLGEGMTPLLETNRLAAAIGSKNLYIKDEGINPSASFKSRGMSAAVSRAKELGFTKLSVPTAGNAGGALAIYAAAANMEAHIVLPKDAQASNLKEASISNARLTLIDGLIGDAGKISRAMAAEQGLFDLSTLKEPYRLEGKKTMGYEIAEQFGWQVPDAIVYPTGGGTGIVGIWKAFEELESLGWIDNKRPRMFCVQAENCAPIVKAFHEGSETAKPWNNAQTMASGLRVPSAIADYLILRILRESHGGAVTVSDAEMLAGIKQVATLEGVFMCPEGAATAVGAQKLLSDGTLSPQDRVVLLNTGSGLKYLDLLEQPTSQLATT